MNTITQQEINALPAPPQEWIDDIVKQENEEIKKTLQRMKTYFINCGTYYDLTVYGGIDFFKDLASINSQAKEIVEFKKLVDENEYSHAKNADGLRCFEFWTNTETYNALYNALNDLEKKWGDDIKPKPKPKPSKSRPLSKQEKQFIKNMKDTERVVKANHKIALFKKRQQTKETLERMLSYWDDLSYCEDYAEGVTEMMDIFDIDKLRLFYKDLASIKSRAKSIVKFKKMVQDNCSPTGTCSEGFTYFELQNKNMIWNALYDLNEEWHYGKNENSFINKRYTPERYWGY